MSGLTYGPKGNPQSKDPYERAQAQMPEGWHVEGQMLNGQMMATNRDGSRVSATPDKLVRAVQVADKRRPKYGLARPYGSLSARDLERELATQLHTPVEGAAIEVTAFGDANRSWLMPDRSYGASHVVTTNAATLDADNVITSTNTFDMGSGLKYTLEQSYLTKPDGSIKAIGPTKVREREESIGRETDLQWLRRRVDEILWVMP